MSDQTDILPEYIRPGAEFDIGTYTFTKDEIIRFASAWDPQPFHVDREEAKSSLLGGLCASGWHTVSVWMKLQRKAIAAKANALADTGQPVPEFGPSPGMQNIKWIKPVFVDDTITYTNSIHGLRESGSRPGWSIMQSSVSAKNQRGDTVMTFNSAVFIKPLG